MGNKKSSSKKDKNGYYGYRSESADDGTLNAGEESSKLRHSTVIGGVMAVIQLIASFAFVALLLYKNFSFVTAPVLGVIIAILVILLAVVFSMQQRRSIKTKRGGKVICVIVIVILAALIYFIAPWDRMDGKKISDDPFVVFVSATDDFGDISETSNERSDTNILAVVNPKTQTALMVTTPRDSYVEIQAQSVAPNSFDKLTHVGLYGNGIAYNSSGSDLTASEWMWADEVNWHTGYDALMDTLKNLYGFDVDSDHYYYAKINFTGFAGIVDALGGITVNVDTAFSTKTYASYGDYDTGERKTYTYTEGDMKMDGATALTYARERHSFSTGDMQRNKNQVKVIEAIVDKLISGSTLLHYNSVINAVEGSYSTDIDISSMVQLVGNGLKNWQILSYSTTGSTGSAQLTWGGSYASVVFPDETSVAQAATLIDMTLDGEDSENISAKIESYEE